MSIFAWLYRRPNGPAYVPGLSGDLKIKSFPMGEGFDWTKATTTPFGSSYFGSDTLTFSLGDKDWMPIGIAMTAMLAGWNEHDDPLHNSPEIVLRRFLFQYLWLMPNDRRFGRWLEENRASLAKVQLYESSQRQKEMPVPEGVPFVDSLDAGSETIAEWYISAVERYRPPAAERRAVLCDGYDYGLNEKIEAARCSAKDALDVTERLAMAWFEARGATVDLDRKLVRIEGYRPIVACDEFLL